MYVPWYMGYIQWQLNRQVGTKYGPILLEHAGSGPNMQSRYYANIRIYMYEGANCGFVVTLRYRLAAACPSMVWLLQQLPSALHAKERQILCRFP